MLHNTSLVHKKGAISQLRSSLFHQLTVRSLIVLTDSSGYSLHFETAFSLLGSGGYGLANNERLSAAVDIIELVKNKLRGNE